MRIRIIDHVTVKGRDLQDNAGNWRIHPQAQVDAVNAILANIGIVDELLIYRSERQGGWTVIDGHLRKDQHQDVEWPCTVVDLSDTEADAVLAAFDRLTAKAEADNERLGALIQRVQEQDAALLAGVFERDEVAEILALARAQQEPVADPGAQVDRAAELQEKWGTALGQVWEVGRHRVVCGDCTDAAVVEAVMRGEKADAVATDPPYGIGLDTDYTRFTTGFDVKRTTHAPIAGDDKPFDPRPFLDYDAVVLWGANFYARYLPIGSWLIWDKRFKNKTAFLSDAELAWMKGGHGIYIFSLTSQGCVRPEKVQHPTQKPVDLIVWCMEKCKAGQLVYDPFLGSGTTAVACEQLGRKCRGVEISPAYIAVSLQRLADLGLAPRLVSA